MTAGYRPVSCQSRVGTNQSLTQDSNQIDLQCSEVVQSEERGRREGGEGIIAQISAVKKKNAKRATSVAVST